jgi:hypothetical protein
MATDTEKATAIALSAAYFIAAFRSGQARRSVLLDILAGIGVIVLAGIIILENL